jgi:hypothetical protein
MLPFISQSREESLTVFETLNSKGVGLSHLDILKSVLFEAVKEDDDEWVKISNAWKGFLAVYEPTKIVPNKFLRYTVVTQFGENRPAMKCLSWIKDNPELTRVASDPLFMIDRLRSSAVAIREMQQGHGPDWSKSQRPNMYIQNMIVLAPSSEQQYFLLIPVWNAAKELFDATAAVAESVVFLNRILSHYTGTTEKNFIEWGRELGRRSSSTSYALEFLDTDVWPKIRAERSRVESMLLTITWKNTNHGLIGWILKRCEIQAAYLNHEDTSMGVDAYGEVDVEHIEPQHGSELNETIVHSLGNLTLQEKGFNRANGRKSFEVKLASYGKSKFRITNALAGIPSTGGSSKKALDLFYSATDWGGIEIRERGNKLVGTLLSVLGFQKN